MRRMFWAVAVGLSFSSGAVSADSYLPFGNFRQVDATGRFYLVVKKGEGAPSDPGRGTPVIFEIVERKPATSPVLEVTDQVEFDRVTLNADVKVRDGDIIRGRGKLERCPAHLLISSTGLGFVGLDVRGYNYGLRRSGDAVVIIGGNGTIRHRKDLIDLFTEGEIGEFRHTAGGVLWMGGGWIDEEQREIVVVSSGHGSQGRSIRRLFRIVSLETGHVRESSTKEVVTSLAAGNRGALDFALALTAELTLRDTLKHLPGIFTNEQLPLATRLRAAVALATLGDGRGGELMSKEALKETEAQYYAVKQLPVVLGGRAAPVLCDTVRRYGDRCRLQAWQAMSSVSSEAAVPALIRLLDENGSIASQTFAAECLGNKGPAAKAAVPYLIKVLQASPRKDGLLSTHEYAAIALGDIGPEAKGALPVLIQLAEVQAKDEWHRAKDRQPESRPDNFGGRKYSDDYFVDAIWKIRHKGP